MLLASVVIALLLAPGLPQAAQEPPASVDVTGNWIGEFKTPASYSPIPLYFKLRQTAKGVAGTAGPSSSEQMPITHVTREGKRLAFGVSTEGITYFFDLTVSDDRLEGDARSEDTSGHKILGKAALKRDAQAAKPKKD